MSEQWAEYERPDGDTVTLQGDAGNRSRYTAKGFKFVKYVNNLTASQNVGVQDPHNVAINVIQGRKVEDIPDVDNSQVVKEAMEVALRKITGTWTDAEQIAAYQSHKEGHLLPEESDEMLTGDPTAGYEAIAPKLTSGELLTPLQEAQAAQSPGAPPEAAVGTGTSSDGTSTTSGTDGVGTPAPTPAPSTSG